MILCGVQKFAVEVVRACALAASPELGEDWGWIMKTCLREGQGDRGTPYCGSCQRVIVAGAAATWSQLPLAPSKPLANTKLRFSRKTMEVGDPALNNLKLCMVI